MSTKMSVKPPLRRASSSNAPSENNTMTSSSHLHKMNSLQNPGPSDDPDHDYLLDQSSLTFTEDYSASSFLSSSLRADGGTLETLTPSRNRLTEPDLMTYHKKSYHKCNAENRDPRCVCSAKLGLDFPNLPDDVFHDSNPATDSETVHGDRISLNANISPENSLNRSLNLSGDQNQTLKFTFTLDLPTTPDEPIFPKHPEDAASSLEHDGSRRSSITSVSSEPKDAIGTQFGGAADSGVGSSRSGKFESAEYHDGTALTSILPTTPRELSGDVFSPLFSPKSSCDSDPEESNSHHWAYKPKRRTLSDSESSWSSSFSSNGYLNELVAECERFMKVFVTKIFSPE